MTVSFFACFMASKINAMSHKITSLTIVIPYKRAGNIISQEPVDFELYREDDHYRLVPRLSEEEIRVANLPPVLRFTMKNGKPVSLRGKLDGNFHVIQDAVKMVQQLNLTL